MQEIEQSESRVISQERTLTMVVVVVVGQDHDCQIQVVDDLVDE